MPINEDLTSYIKNGLAAGQSEDLIRQQLLQTGWTQDNIDAAFNSLKNPPSQETKGHRNFKLTKSSPHKIKCPLCKGKISSDALRCSHCAGDLSGEEARTDIEKQLKERRKKMIKRWVFYGSSLVIFIILVGSISNDSSYRPPTTGSAPSLLDTCLKIAWQNYEEEWSNTCKEEGKPADCKKLDSRLVVILDNRYANQKNECYQLYR